MDNINSSEILNPLLEKYKKNIIKDTIKKIYEKYSIYDDNENLINEIEVIEYIKRSNQVHFKKRCCGISRSKQCTKTSIEKYDYCKSHIMMYKKNNNIENLDIDNEINIEIINNLQSYETINMKKKFISDSFYYVDNKFIYDNFKEKVGYIQDNEYYLTDDPFILTSFS